MIIISADFFYFCLFFKCCSAFAPMQGSLILPPTWTTCISWHCASVMGFTRLSAGYLCSNWDLVWLCCWQGLTTFICCASSLLGMATHTHEHTHRWSDVWQLVVFWFCWLVCSFKVCSSKAKYTLHHRTIVSRFAHCTAFTRTHQGLFLTQLVSNVDSQIEHDVSKLKNMNLALLLAEMLSQFYFYSPKSHISSKGFRVCSTDYLFWPLIQSNKNTASKTHFTRN